ncbi:MAG: roadblock/LC7 domain-containing protein [Verrucomicrobiota bacterium]
MLSLSADRLGFDPHKIPDDLETSLAGSLLEPKLNDAGVRLALSDIVDGCPERYRPAFSRSDRNTPVEIPAEKIQPQLIEEKAEAPEKSTAAEPSEEFNPFAMLESKAPETDSPAEATKEKKPDDSAASPFAQLPKLGDSPVAMPGLPKSEEPAAEAPAAPTGSLFGGAPTEPTETKEKANPFSALASVKDQNGKPDGDNGSTLPPMGASPWGAAGAVPSSVSKPAPEPLESLPLGNETKKDEKESPAAEPTIPGGFDGASFPDEEDGQGVLRALFMTDEKLDTAKVIEFCGELPGIQGCALLSKDGSIAASSKSDGNFESQAKDAHESLQKMVGALGVDDAEVFTLRSNKAMLSFFQANDACVAVEHEKTGFQPGVQEKLGLVAKEIDALAS